jgi:hypothetical protein
MIPAITGATGIVANGFKKDLESITGKTFNRFTIKDSCTCNITHNTGSTAVHGRWGSPLVQKKYQGERDCDKRKQIIIIIIIIIS